MNQLAHMNYPLSLYANIFMMLTQKISKYRMNQRKFLVSRFKTNPILFLVLTCLAFSCSKSNKDVFTVMSGSFTQSIRQTGELQSVKASFIPMPSIDWQYGYQFKIIGLAEHGKIVHKGDSIIKLDATSVYKFIIEREDMLENELADAKKQVVQSENNIQELTAQFKSEQASYNLKKLEVERSKFDSDVKKRIKELEFKQEIIKLNKVKRNLDLKPKLDDYDRIIKKIKVAQRQNELNNAKDALKLFLLKSPLDGIFQVAVNEWTDNPQMWKVGDTPYQGQILSSIPDVTWMKVKTYVNESDAKKVYKGMKVIVRLDALPSVPFSASITEISKICVARDKEKVFNIVVGVDVSDLRLKPGMTVNCEYILYESDKNMFVPNNCLLKERGHSYVFLKKGGSVRKVEVQAGASNINHTVVTGEVKPGQRLVPFNDVLNPKNI
jgi:multidrug efflux pump subunit AcrA (membrane-fusion protein)